MSRLFRSRLHLLCIAGALSCALQASAMTRVTLRNGFSYDCASQQLLDPDHTRLLLSASPAVSYVDVPTAEIVAVEALPPQPNPVPGGSPASLPDIPTLLSSAGEKHNIDVELLASVVHAESSGRTHAVSRTGARGLMQLMPATAQSLGVRDSLQPDQNINGGTAYLDALLTRYHDSLSLALAAYNAGPGAVDRYHGIPPYRETQVYVVRVMNEFKRRKAALDHNSAHARQASR